jgi:hypothetical protein
MQVQPRGYGGRGSTEEGAQGGFDPIILAAIEVKNMEYDKILFTYYLCTVQTLMKLVAQIRFTSLLGIRLLRYLGTSGLT